MPTAMTGQAGMAAQIAAADVDPLARQDSPVAPHRYRRRTAIFVGCAAIAYVIGLIATIPAAAVLDESDRLAVGGTIWNGEAVLASTIRVEWSFAPLTTLSRLAFSADWRITGGGTDLAGMISQRGDVMTLHDAAGQIDGSLLNALFPGLPLTCSFTGTARIDNLRLGGDDQAAQANFVTGPVTCAAKAMAALPVQLPPLTADVVASDEASAGALMTEQSKEHLVEMRLDRDGMLSIWPTPMAVERLPLLAGRRYDTRID